MKTIAAEQALSSIPTVSWHHGMISLGEWHWNMRAGWGVKTPMDAPVLDDFPHFSSIPRYMVKRSHFITTEPSSIPTTIWSSGISLNHIKPLIIINNQWFINSHYIITHNKCHSGVNASVLNPSSHTGDPHRWWFRPTASCSPLPSRCPTCLCDGPLQFHHMCYLFWWPSVGNRVNYK